MNGYSYQDHGRLTRWIACELATRPRTVAELVADLTRAGCSDAETKILLVLATLAAIGAVEQIGDTFALPAWAIADVPHDAPAGAFLSRGGEA